MASNTDFLGQAGPLLTPEENAIALTTPDPFLPGLGPVSTSSASVGTVSPQLSQDVFSEDILAEAISAEDTTVTGLERQSSGSDRLTGLALNAAESGADLVAIAFDATIDHVLTGSTTATFILQNQGTADASEFEVDIVYSNDDVFGNDDDQVVATVTISTLSVGQVLSQTIDVQLPLGTLNANALAEDATGEGADYVSLNKDFLGLVVDAKGAIAESNETNNQNQGKGKDQDDITYFPWDIDGNGQVTPTDAIFAINRLGQSVDESNARADFDGNGAITPTDAIAAINRLGYSINSDVIEPVTPLTTTITEISPANGSEMVTLTREAIVRFSKRVDPATVTSESIKFVSLGAEVAGRLVVSSTEKFATFFPSESWNPSAEVRIIVDGDKIIGRDGTALDADSDGIPGGKVTADFTTLPITRIPDTDVFGFVYDSYNRNSDGSNIPLEGVIIRVDALPELTAVTDENGYFILEDVPAPEFHVYIDASEVADVPEGSQYASLGKAFHSVPGQPTRLFMDGEDFDIYLPLMSGDDIVELSPTEDTAVGFGSSAQTFLAEQFPDVDPEIWERTQVTFIAGSAQDEQGNVATQATIVPVNSDRLPAPLPPGLDLPLVISIQAGGDNGFNREVEGGATNFDVPAPVTFPNLDGLAPGEKSLIWSFNHDAAKWEVIGTGTVSEDGKTITSDEGVGIQAPGWHGVAPGVPANSEPPSEPEPELDYEDIKEILNNDYQSKIGTAGAALAHQLACIAQAACDNEDTWGSGFVKEVLQDVANSVKNFDFRDTLPNALLAGTPIPAYSDKIIERLPNWALEIGDTDIIRLGDISAVLGGFGRHFPYELLPSFFAHADQLDDETHNMFFEQGIVPCFDDLVADGEISSWAGKVAQTIVPPSAIVLREFVQAVDSVLDFGRDLFRSIGSNFSESTIAPFSQLGTSNLTTSSLSDELQNLPSKLTREDLYSTDIDSITTLDVSAEDLFFTPVGSTLQLNVTKQNGDGTVTNLTSSDTGTQYFAIVGDETVEVTEEGLMSILGTPSPIEALTPSLYILVRNGDDVGIGQFAITDIDTDGDLIVDSYEQLVGLDPNAANGLESDLDKDGLVDLAEVLLGTLPTNIDTDGDGINDRTEVLSETGARYSSSNLVTQDSEHYFSVADVNTGFVQRGKTKKDGTIDELVLSQDSEYVVSFFNSQTLKYGSAKFSTPDNVSSFNLPKVVIGESSSPDTDGDKLPDVAEFVLGTSINDTDTDSDGISDFAEIEQGLDPLGGQGFLTGIIANLPLSGEAREVVVEGATNSIEGQTAYVATGSHGLAIIDASQFNSPIVQGQINLAGDNIDVAVDSDVNIAAVAGQSGGLHLVDISDSMTPTLIKTVDLAVNQVEISDGIIYASVGNSVKMLDVFSGEELEPIELSGSGFVSDIAVEGSTLYTYLSGSDTLSAIDINNPGTASVLDEINVSVASSSVGISVGNGVAYIAGSGLRTVDVSDPTDLSLIGDADSFFTARDIALNGSGLGLVAAENQGVGIYSLSDPTDTDALFTQIDTDGTTYDIAIASGIAYVADGSGDLKVINYLPFDSQGQAPTVSISSAADVDSSQAGIQVLEGASVPIQVDVTDDVQVRNVELLIDGEVVSNDVSFPFDLNAVALSNSPLGTSVDIQVRATDTGGNSALSNVLTVDLVPDTFAPEITSTSPSEGTRRRAISGFSVRFNEPIDPDLLTESGIKLRNLGEDGTAGGGDDSEITLSNYQLSESGRTLFITAPSEDIFTAGNYELRIAPAVISDRAGNNRTEAFTLAFTKRSVSDPLTFGELIEDAIFEPGEDQIFTFTGTAGQRIFFDGTDSTFGINARLLSPSGASVSSLSTASDSNPISLLESGTYQWVITGSGNTTGDYSFRVFDLTTADTLTLDTDVNGTLDPGSSAALYQFEGIAGQQLFFDGQSADSGSTFYLYGPGNQQIIARATRSDQAIELPGEGTYTVAIRGFANESHNFSFRLSTPDTTETALTLGDAVSSSISEPGEVDVYTFEGSAGQQLFYDGFNSDASLVFRLLTPSGDNVSNFFTSFTNSDRESINLLEDGTYQLVVSGNGGINTGDYGFQLTDLSTVTALQLDTDITGTLDPGSSAALYQFEGTKGQQLFFDGQSTDNSSTFYLYGPGNQQLAARSTLSDQAIELPGAGTYTVAIRGFATEANDFSFRLSTPDTTETALTLGDTVSGSISEPGEVDVYTFEGSAGQQLFYDGFNSDASLFFRLLSPSGENVINFFSSSTGNDRESINLLENGTYQLIVNDNGGSNTGDYGFQLADLATVEVLQLDTDVSGTLDPGSSAALYQFEGTAGQQLFFDGQSTNNGSTFYLYGPGNQQITARSTRSDQVIALPGEGTYTVAIRGFANEANDFSFRLSTPDTTEIALTLGNAVSSSISEPGEVDVYTFEGSAGQKLFYDGFNSDASLVFNLISPSGDNVSNFFTSFTSSDRESINLLENGTYRLIVNGNGGINVGDYGFQLTDLTTVDTLVLDTDISGTLDPGSSAALYQLEGVAGQQLFFDGQSTDNGSTFYLYGSGNQQLAARSTRFDQAIALPGDGTYFVAIRGSANEANDFSFRLTEQPFEAPEPVVGEALTLGTLTEGAIAVADEVDTYLFDGTAGQRLYYDGISGIASIDASLVSPSGVTVFSFNNANRDRGPITLLESGEYQLRLDGSGSTTGDYGFQLLDLAEATDLPFDTVVSGTLEAGRATDFFQFEGTAGQQLFIEGLGEQSGGTFYLYGSNNQQVTAVNFVGNLDITLPGTGTYYLAAESFSDVALDYSFQIITNTASTTVLTLGDPVTSTISKGGEVDVYTFSATAGQRLYYDGISGSTSIDASLVSPSGVVVFSFNNVNNDRGPISLLESGEYQLRLDGSGSTTGDYSFQLLDLAEATNLAFNTVVSSTLEAGRDTDFFQFEGTAGQQLFIEGLGEQSGGIFYLYGPNNQQVTAANFISSFDITLPGTGTYYLAAESFSDVALDYSLQISTPSVSTTALTLGETVTSTISEGGEVDVYTFSATAGQRLYYDGISGSASIDASLVSTSGVTVFSFNNVNNDRGPISLLESGEYQLRLDGSGSTTGDYSFQLLDLAEGTDLTFDTVVSGTLEAGRDTDFFQFEGTAGQQLFIEGLGEQSNGIFYLYGSNNQQVTAVNFVSSIDITLPGTGTYYLAAESFSDVALDYSFRIGTPSVSTTALTLGETVTSTISEGGEVDVYTFTGTAGQRIFFDGLGGDNFSLFASLVSPSGINNLSFVRPANNTAPITLLESGEYQLRLDGSGTATGDYSFRLLNARTAAPLPIGSTISGTLNPGTATRIFTFEGTANQNLSFEELGSRRFGGIFKLYGPGNQSIVSRNLGFDFEVTLPGSGQYLLALEGSDADEAVNYRFRVV
ncbi:Ig-like domain-containing protein [cf. Phormidesmis sp. LEGE 11477]|uniref:Ig-like domain-containing protein n=1 Tax=cf. Phormidesmis sp. LEGE 11477 TaxID=1828680 RepID=UPI00187F815F|nr:Ig-like domain-containing protein [cf. Phormidesmis sp. LEGE 11477]MBE9061109.1 Ig-like domain-containing protein [cf. Phormidesmis sp. LEGE 11477]